MRLSTGSFYCHRLSSKIHYFDDSSRRRITQAIFFSWVLTASYNALQDTLCIVLFQNNPYLFAWLNITSTFLLCILLILCFVSMIFHVYVGMISQHAP